jgi:putative ABC transport system substrate-binding protein
LSKGATSHSNIALRMGFMAGCPRCADLVRRQVAVIYAAGSHNATLAAKAATATTPIVFATGLGDPIALGLVASLNRPGGNVTGVMYYASELLPKRLELLRELAPQVRVIGFLTNPASLASDGDVPEVQAAARSVGQEIVVLKASTVTEIDDAFAAAAERGVGALLVSGAFSLPGTLNSPYSRRVTKFRRITRRALTSRPAV